MALQIEVMISGNKGENRSFGMVNEGGRMSIVKSELWYESM